MNLHSNAKVTHIFNLIYLLNKKKFFLFIKSINSEQKKLFVIQIIYNIINKNTFGQPPLSFFLLWQQYCTFCSEKFEEFTLHILHFFVQEVETRLKKTMLEITKPESPRIKEKQHKLARKSGNISEWVSMSLETWSGSSTVD